MVRNVGRVSRRVLEAAPRLKVIGRHGAGLETIDLEAAAERGVRVVFTPEANRQSVAEHFVAMALVLSKRLLEADRALREGRWEVRYEYFGPGDAGQDPRGGRIRPDRPGAPPASAHHGFAMPVLYCDRQPVAAAVEAELGAPPGRAGGAAGRLRLRLAQPPAHPRDPPPSSGGSRSG